MIQSKAPDQLSIWPLIKIPLDYKVFLLFCPPPEVNNKTELQICEWKRKTTSVQLYIDGTVQAVLILCYAFYVLVVMIDDVKPTCYSIFVFIVYKL